MPPKSKQPESSSFFPWDDLKAVTLRNLCAELGYRYLSPKSQMIAFLRDVETSGLQEALNNVTNQPSNAPPTSPTSTSTRNRKQSLKRKEEEALADDVPEVNSGLPYNTRHKGLKRPRVAYEPESNTPPPRKPRVSKAQPFESISEGPASEAPVKRGRGRPPKSGLPVTAPAISLPTSAAPPAGGAVKRRPGRPRKSTGLETTQAAPPKKEVFYGVVMTKPRVREFTEDDDADGEADDGEGEDNVPVVPNGGETSSLGSSNKENHPEPPAEEAIVHTSLVDALNFATSSTYK